jgi:hypothetical protein
VLKQTKPARGAENKEHAMSEKLNTAIAVIGIDIGKNSFAVDGREQETRTVAQRQSSERNPLHMIAKEGLPRLQWPIAPRHHVDQNRGLGDLDAELEQLAMDLGSAPQRVLKTHSSDQIAHLCLLKTSSIGGILVISNPEAPGIIKFS